ncbi:MAG: prephenate dehydrogenase/arogenate dehydrogenase family protein [Coriobacteriia bacterium]
MFSSVMVVGLGLIGGSIAAAAHALPDAPIVYGVDTDSTTLAYAIETRAVDAAAQPDEAIASGWLAPGTVDLVVLATPARAVGTWLEHLAHAGYAGIVTDVSSTKRGVMAAAKRHAGDAFSFVGGHPMAGSERSGIQAATPELFRGAYYVLTPTDDTDADAFRQVHEFVTALGARAISVPAEAHDEAVALISHVPHVTAAALVALASARSGGGQDALRLAAGGFKDMTRVAAGSPELWTGICLDNAEPLVSGLAELSRVLEEFAISVREGNAEAIQSWFAGAADVRRSLPAQWVPATTALTELSLAMIDRPGQVSEITTAVGRAGCNIEDIEIDHETEDSAILRLVLTDEGDYDALTGALEALGYEPRMRTLG